MIASTSSGKSTSIEHDSDSLIFRSSGLGLDQAAFALELLHPSRRRVAPVLRYESDALVGRQVDLRLHHPAADVVRVEGDAATDDRQAPKHVPGGPSVLLLELDVRMSPRAGVVKRQRPQGENDTEGRNSRGALGLPRP
jgi:hypothetical protein